MWKDVEPFISSIICVICSFRRRNLKSGSSSSCYQATYIQAGDILLKSKWVKWFSLQAIHVACQVFHLIIRFNNFRLYVYKPPTLVQKKQLFPADPLNRGLIFRQGA